MGNSHKISAALSIMFPASLLLAGSIFTSYADTRRASAHPAPSAAPVDSMESRQAALPAQSAISLLAAAVDTTDLEEVELPFRTIVEEVPDVDPVAWADTALFHFHNPATDSRYLRLTDDDYRTIAEELGVETAAIKAVVDIEAGPSHKGFWKPGKPLINFDLSMFQQFARRRGVSLEKARKSSPVIFRKPDRAKYGSYQGAQYARLEAAAKICKPLGVESCFWGMFQIGGFNWRKCGCDNIEEFVALMSRSERDQLELFARFIESNGLVEPIRQHQWLKFALRYNGPKAKARGYHTRLASAYRKYKNQEARR